MTVKERFLKYVAIDTTSNSNSAAVPTTPNQLVLADLLAEELRAIGVSDVVRDENGYVYGKIPATVEKSLPKLGFIAHMDTSEAASGANIKPRLIPNYDGKDILLNAEKNITMKVSDFPFLADYKGQELITTDGLTLLGADDKAGVAEIVSAAEYLIQHPEIPHGPLRICFTPDEEVGAGTDHINMELLDMDFAYTMDGSALGELEYENFNAASASVEITGLSIHPGSAKNQMINALLIGMEFQSLLPVFQRPEFTEGYEGFFLLDEFHGSVEHAKMEYIIRDHDLALFEEKKAMMQKAADFINTKYGQPLVALTIKDSYFNMREKILPHPELLEHVLAVYEKLNITPKVSPIRGGTDGARLSFMGLPCPNLGTGGHNFHGPLECACVNSMEKAVEVIIELARSYAE